MSNTNARQTFTKEFKLDVINQSDRCDKITNLAADLGLCPELIYRWQSEHKTDPQGSFPGNGVEKQTPEEEKIDHLQRQLADMRTQRDILIKAMGIFVGHPE